MRNQVIRSQMRKMPFILHPTMMDALLEMANSETPRVEGVTPSVANNSVKYEKIGTTAIISIDGGMYKKDIGGMCSSVASYDKMVEYIDQAEKDTEVKTVVYRVDTGGGAVAGADEVEDKIFKSKKKTITFYENMGASGGIWIFSASDEIYATESTMLGSIGVVVSYMEKDEETGEKRVEIVSKNAQNKRCSLNGTCKQEIQGIIDTYEEMFYARVEKNTGFTAEMIQKTFNNGGMIFAKEAEKAGFIQGITTFDDLMKSLYSGVSILGTNPLAKAEQIDQISMKESDLNLQAQLDEANEGLKTSTEANSKLEIGLSEANGKIEALTAQLQESVVLAKANAEKVASLEAKASALPNIVAMGIERGADKSTILAMIGKESVESASAVLVDAMGQFDAISTPKAEQDDEASKNLEARCNNIGLVIVGGNK